MLPLRCPRKPSSETYIYHDHHINLQSALPSFFSNIMKRLFNPRLCFPYFGFSSVTCLLLDSSLIALFEGFSFFFYFTIRVFEFLGFQFWKAKVPCTKVSYLKIRVFEFLIISFCSSFRTEIIFESFGFIKLQLFWLVH